MPTYLVHGFRWDRIQIRVHVIRHDVEDAATEWIMGPSTSVALLNSFYTLFDFLPPSSPPLVTRPVSQSPARSVESETAKSPNRLSKKNTKSRQSMKAGLSLKKGKPADINTTAAKDGPNGRQNTPPSRSYGTSPTSSSANTTTPAAEAPFNSWSVVKILEQYDPEDLTSASQPYAYLSDYILPVTLGISIAEEINKYEAVQRAEEIAIADPAEGVSERETRRRSRRLGWFEKLRDEVGKGAEIGWFVVVCGDEERDFGNLEESASEDGEVPTETVKSPRSAGLRGFFGRREKKVVTAE
ncbi:hypothetical protein GLAREA_12725 [Glarea lozoyensis ATCC 20868]|uniref:Uncharacterized protein n=1 Tax=Glarea lozoyensis (strain ATCC 20868 / MF5171) TaxID=1116229 RepID=S3CYT4_GLAL2|nr:uncharacterized protein GLAREA_12725 [Glarea lozoyensis ATCC 20868]EPE31422.1 hypothetical protein GLAREA_12725 [Glarea lozoyensis ATCC 20868]